MKTFAIIFAGILSAQAVQLSAQGIDEKELMEGNHWRKVWPEGNTDNSDGDSDVINTFLKPKAPKPEPENTNGMSMSHILLAQRTNSKESTTENKVLQEQLFKN